MQIKGLLQLQRARQKGPARDIFFSYDLSRRKQESITELDNLKLSPVRDK